MGQSLKLLSVTALDFMHCWQVAEHKTKSTSIICHDIRYRFCQFRSVTSSIHEKNFRICRSALLSTPLLTVSEIDFNYLCNILKCTGNSHSITSVMASNSQLRSLVHWLNTLRQTSPLIEQEMNKRIEFSLIKYFPFTSNWISPSRLIFQIFVNYSQYTPVIPVFHS